MDNEELVVHKDLTPPSAALADPRPRAIAPIWHTLVLLTAILAISAMGSTRIASAAATANPARLAHYALSATMELLLVAWLALGLRLRKRPLRSLFGAIPHGIDNILREAGIALIFWLVSMFVLGSFALTWNLVQTRIYMRHLQTRSANPSAPEKSPKQQQIEMAKKLMSLAPDGALQIAAWAALCLIVGFSEELIFRGYLQAQAIALFGSHRFGVPLGVLCSALIFGAAHGYQGLRGMFLIAIYGALFSGISLLRRSLFPGMLAHSWHDFATGMLLAFIRQSHLLDHLPLH